MAESSPHRRHDQFAIAAAVSDGFTPATASSCPACGALHADLLTLRTALRHAWTPRRTRDMILSPDTAARIRPGRWRRMLDAVGTRRDLVTRPAAISLAGLGLAGIVLSSLSTGMGGMATQETTRQTGAAAVMIAGESTPPGDRAVAAPAGGEITVQDRAADPLALVSVAFLAASGAVFGARRLARSRGAMR